MHSIFFINIWSEKWNKHFSQFCTVFSPWYMYIDMHIGPCLKGTGVCKPSLNSKGLTWSCIDNKLIHSYINMSQGDSNTSVCMTGLWKIRFAVSDQLFISAKWFQKHPPIELEENLKVCVLKYPQYTALGYACCQTCKSFHPPSQRISLWSSWSWHLLYRDVNVNRRIMTPHSKNKTER